MARKEHVWVIDDDHSIRWVLEKALSRETMAVSAFDSGNAALAALERGSAPDAIVADIRMPGINGLELLARLREQVPDLPVIIMTAHSDLDSAVAAYQGGAFEYLPKPFDVDEAVALVRRACDLRRQQAAVTAPQGGHLGRHGIVRMARLRSGRQRQVGGRRGRMAWRQRGHGVHGGARACRGGEASLDWAHSHH